MLSLCGTVVVAMATAVAPAQRASNAVFTIQPASEPSGRAAKPSSLGPSTTSLCCSLMIRGSQTDGQTDGHIVCRVESGDTSPSHNVRNAGAVSEAERSRVTRRPVRTYCLCEKVAGSILLGCLEFAPLYQFDLHSQTTGTSTTLSSHKLHFYHH